MLVNTYRNILFGVLAGVAPVASLADDAEGPETGFFRIYMTPIEVIGEQAASGVAEVLPPDQEINWQLYVPHDYSADNPPGVIVYVSPSEKGGPPWGWNDLLAERNLIWIGANGSGNKNPVAERMLKAIIATEALQKNYTVNPERFYIAGYSGGGITATRIAAVRPEQFKGGIYIAGSVFWGDETPPKIETIRQNRHVFLIGTYDPALKTVQRVYKDYVEAGVVNSKLITVRNHNHRMPPIDYFVRAIEYLDAATTTQSVKQ